MQSKRMIFNPENSPLKLEDQLVNIRASELQVKKIYDINVAQEGHCVEVIEDEILHTVLQLRVRQSVHGQLNNVNKFMERILEERG